MVETHNITASERAAFMQANKIAIIGMPLAGKSTLVRALHGQDLDDVIEARTNRAIPELLEAGVFRQEETNTLAHLVAGEAPLIALGGGAILKQENLDLLKDYFVVFLNTPLTVLHERLTTNVRPLIKEPADLDRLFAERYPLYCKAASLHVDGVTLQKLLEEKRSR